MFLKIYIEQISTGVITKKMSGLKDRLKKFFKDPKAKVAASVIGGVLVIVVTLLFIQLLSPRNKDKPSATSRTRKDTSVGGVNKSTG